MYAFKVCLYVAGQSDIENLKNFLEKEFEERYELEIINLLENPALAEEKGILATPTLEKVTPSPGKRIICSLKDPEKALAALDLLSRN